MRSKIHTTDEEESDSEVEVLDMGDAPSILHYVELSENYLRDNSDFSVTSIDEEVVTVHLTDNHNKMLFDLKVPEVMNIEHVKEKFINMIKQRANEAVKFETSDFNLIHDRKKMDTDLPLSHYLDNDATDIILKVFLKLRGKAPEVSRGLSRRKTKAQGTRPHRPRSQAC